MEAKLRDTEVHFDRQAVTLCPHDKVPVQPVRNGELKAVNRNSAHLLLEAYGILDADFLTGYCIIIICAFSMKSRDHHMRVYCVYLFI